MLKTLERNWIAQEIKAYWKRFVGWVTALKTKYDQDLFFRTECKVIFFQVLCAMTLLLLVSFAFDYLYQNITQTLVTGIIENVSHSNNITGKDIVDTLAALKTKNFVVLIIVTSIITILFGYAMGKVTFAPARNVLESQKRFVSDIAHELRTPLSIIKINSEIALLNPHVSANIQETLRSNIEELDRTSEIINNLLTLSNFLRHEQINFTNVDLGSVVDRAVKSLEEFSKNKHLDVRIQKKGPSIVWGNTTALEQIVVNLVRNAITYTSPFGQIVVSVEPDYRANILLIVSDTGIGISQNDLFHIFEPFYRADRSRTRQSGSSGLGLTIVSELTKLHGGKIAIRSAIDRGTVATVTLPYSKINTSAETIKASEELNEISVDFLSKSEEGNME